MYVDRNYRRPFLGETWLRISKIHGLGGRKVAKSTVKGMCDVRYIEVEWNSLMKDFCLPRHHSQDKWITSLMRETVKKYLNGYLI